MLYQLLFKRGVKIPDYNCEIAYYIILYITLHEKMSFTHVVNYQINIIIYVKKKRNSNILPDTVTERYLD